MNLLNIAPHVHVPPKDGADVRTWCLSRELAQAGNRVELVSRNFVTSSFSEFPHHSIDKSSLEQLYSVVRALLTGKSYWEEKMLTSRAWRLLGASDRSKHDTVLLNFLYAVPLLRCLRGQRLRLAVDTHNFDEDYFGRMAIATSNPIVRLLCRRAVRKSGQHLRSLPAGAGMSHVSEEDAGRYEAMRPDLHHCVIPNGCDLPTNNRLGRVRANGPYELVFVGSLSSLMNQQALESFERIYWPLLREVSRLTVAGSNPKGAVMRLCKRNGWTLMPNVTRSALHELYSGADFAILPFSYGAGSKLKLFEALAHGISVLTTPAGAIGVQNLPKTVIVSSDPAAWRAAVTDSNARESEDLRRFLRDFTWEASAVKMESFLKKLQPVLL